MNKIGFKLVIMISFAVLLSVFSTAGIGYLITKQIILQDLEKVKLINLVRLKATEIEKVIYSGIEISKTLAQDATLIKWFKGKEKDDQFGETAKKKLNFITQGLGYSVSFAANKYTNHFWTDSDQLTDVLSKDDTDDSWFFLFLKKELLVEINVEYNRELKRVFVWIKTVFNWKQEIILVMHRIDGTDSVILIRIYKTRWVWSILKPFFRGVLNTALIVLILFTSMFALLSILNTKILTRLSKAILALGEEEFDKDLCGKDIKRKDEFGDIARGYETTRGKLAIAYYNLKALNTTFERFVPKQFLNRIAKNGIEKIQLGEAECDTMAILFSDIRSFTDLSENMSPQDVLNFLNAYFRQMNRPIHDNHGFIDKFIGDAIMALFDRPLDKAKDAVLAAIGMQEALMEYNQHRGNLGYSPISIGIGIHSGPLVIGTVGSEDRMDSTVLGDVVNMASRLEGLTKYYNTQIIISSQIRRQLELEGDSSIFLRELDFVTVKGKKKPEVIFEILNSTSKEIFKLKQKILPLYNKGLANYRSRNWKKSIQLFEKCLELSPEDSVSKIYVERCLYFQNHPPPPEWDGVTHLKQK